MIYKGRSRHSRAPGGYLQFRGSDLTTVHGYCEGDYIRLRDEYGSVWIGCATREDDSELVRYRFRDSNGRSISGISDAHGILLRDEKGNTWRGFVD